MLVTSPEFKMCLPFVLTEEGGYSNTPGDHGGATNFGITQAEYNVFRHSLKLSLQSVKLIWRGEYSVIYWQSYWMPHCQKLPAGLNLTLFNINVNGGSGRGTRIIQQCLGIHVDGIWGDETDRAIAAITPDHVRNVIVAFHNNERAFYQAIINHDHSQQKFAGDWFGRNDRCEKLSLVMASAFSPTAGDNLDSALDAAAKPQPSIIKGGPDV